MKFSITKKGYSKDEVEKYINSLNKDFELVNGELRVRIGDLNGQIDKLRQEIEKYKEQEDLIKNTLLRAQEKAEEIEYASKVRFALEGERLRLFKDKWVKNFRVYAIKNKPNWEREIKEYFDSLVKEVELIFKDNFKVEEYINEAQEEYDNETKRLEK